MSTKYTKPDTLLKTPLNSKQNVYVNYLIPYFLTTFIYILNFAADSVLALQHRRDENYLYASITLFWMYVPVVTCFGCTISNPELWPADGFHKDNLKWLAVMIIQHFAFPIWAMGRFSEQLFWSIEAVRDTDDCLEDLLAKTERNCIFELYHFLQAWLQAAPQILFQLHIIFRQPGNYEKATVDMQVFSIIMSIVKMAMTTMSYQRFKTQKLAGRQYPWVRNDILKREQETVNIEESNKINEQSDCENSEPEADRKRKTSGLSVTSSEFNENEIRVGRSNDEPDLVLPVRIEKGIRVLTQDDAAGKLVSFFWWFCFILPRMFTLSAFAYFYPQEIWWICSSHYVITLAFLLYDARISDIPYFRALFLLFTTYIYMFCLIEFKVKFKKIKFIYIGYFTLVYLENFIMTSMWYFSYDSYDETYHGDWWFQYIFYLILTSSLISAVSMLMYLTTLKPAKITVERP